MKIYFCGSIRGDRSRLATFRFIVEQLQERGHEVLTTHIISDDPRETEKKLTAQQVYVRDILEFLPQADAVVAEVSGPSFGVGFEVGYAIAKAQLPVFLFCERKFSDEDKISNLAKGCTDPHCTIIEYSNNDEIANALHTLIFHTSS